MRFVYDLLLNIHLLQARLQETVAVGGKIDGLLSRIAALEELFATPPGDVAEQRRRDGLIRYVVIPLLTWCSVPSSSFKDIEGRLRPLSERSRVQQLAEHVQENETISGLLEDLQEDINNYRVRS